VSTPAIIAIVVAAAILWALLWMPRRMRTRSYSATTLIQRSPEDVFAFVADLPRCVRILTGAQTVRRLSEGPVALGTRFHSDTVMGSVRFAEENEIVAFEPPRNFAWREAGFASGTESIHLEPDGKATRVTHRYEAVESYPNALLGMVLFGPLLSRAGARDRRKSWASIKGELEGTTPTL
jgi:carbon monoxide dehydrogenase subunit G